MTDGIIRVTGMRFWGKHGALPAERERPQAIDVDAEIGVDCAAAIRSDELASAVDYADVYRACERVVTLRSFALLESLAGACLDAMMTDERVRTATVRVRKPRLFDGATPEVEISRTR